MKKRAEALLRSEKCSEVKQIDDQISHELSNIKAKEREDELEELMKIKEKKGRAAAVFKLKDKIIGNKKEPNGPSVLLDPKTNKLIFKPTEIIEASADYCKKTVDKQVTKGRL